MKVNFETGGGFYYIQYGGEWSRQRAQEQYFFFSGNGGDPEFR